MLYTKRTVIRRFDPGDWEDLYAYLSDAVVVHFEPYDVFSMEECIAEAARRAENPAFWAVCLRENGKLIGNLYLQERDFASWELGYVFNAADLSPNNVSKNKVRILRETAIAGTIKQSEGKGHGT